MKLGLVFGTTRTHSNTLGVLKHIRTLLPSSITLIDISLADSPGHPLPLTIDLMPASIPLSSCPDGYTSPEIRAWSKTILGLDGLLLVAPQYNRGPPAVLKNALDQLYSEWAGLPIGLVSCGSRGGTRLQVVMQELLADGLKMDLVGMVGVKIPKELFVGDDKVEGDEPWLNEYDDELRGLVGKLEEGMKRKVQARKGEEVSTHTTMTRREEAEVVKKQVEEDSQVKGP